MGEGGFFLLCIYIFYLRAVYKCIYIHIYEVGFSNYFTVTERAFRER